MLLANRQLPLTGSQLSVVQGLLSLHTVPTPAMHAFWLQPSPTVHGLPSLHGLALATCTQPPLGSHESSLHGLPSSHTSAAPWLHAPFLQVSLVVHTLPSASHALPSFTGLLLHLPAFWSHWLCRQVVSAVVSHVTTVLGLTMHLYGGAVLSQNNVPLHRFPSSWLAQSTSSAQPQVLVPLTHALPAQASPTVQGLPSSQLFKLAVCPQPLSGAQLSVVQGFPSSHCTSALTGWPLHAPPPHRSPVVHALPSSQGTVLGVFTQLLFGSQESLVHGFLSSQMAEVPEQTPAAHVSFKEHALPSSQGSEFLTYVQFPLPLSQASSVQGLPSSQLVKLPGTQPLALHTSPTVQALLSVHGEDDSKNWQPFSGSHESMVQTFLSSQSRIGPGTQLPPLQVSVVVHTVPSASQESPSFTGT